MKILIIEDQEKLAKAIKAGLEKNGFAADYITDGEAGMRRIAICHKEYDLAILDLMLPNKTGYEICQETRAQDIKIPILVLTAKSSIEDKIELLEMGADDYLIKPFSFEELIARIKALLRRPREGEAPTLIVGNISLNTSTREVYLNNDKLELTLKEFNLLEYLIRHPNQVVNREQILDHIWDFGFDSFSNVVDVHIKNLRKKLGNGQKYLETIRGVGYRFKV